MKSAAHTWFLALSLLAGSTASPATAFGLPQLSVRQSGDCSDLVLSEALHEIRCKQYEQGRLLLKELIATECSTAPIPRLLIADSYYREAGFDGLAEAASEYTRWLEIFPDHKLTALVLQKLAETHLRQLGFGTDPHAALAKRVLLKLQDYRPQLRDNPIIQEYTVVVQELLAEHDLKVAKFYFEQRWKP